ncbi:YraN family protein [Robertkochia solimangrovi]|uniref:YraN family protein n=1 Tax=Robertkochia solimangrovi TaxID=2213046 RepID=UPI00117F7C21|nr:YraN family protein [Robertkochia solimangrovi]TRZ40918.1 YraN family protein [Robertkochia solimangrovi]
MAKHNEFGKEAEELACGHLVQSGFEILERNFRFDRAEVDVIARHTDHIIGVEVKARSTDYFGDPTDFVSDKKIKQLVKAMNHYMVENDLDLEVRFDIIGILSTNDGIVIKHIQDAFYFF